MSDVVEYHSFFSHMKQERLCSVYSTPYSTFCQLIHKQHADSTELYQTPLENKNLFYQNVFRCEFPTSSRIPLSKGEGLWQIYLKKHSYHFLEETPFSDSQPNMSKTETIKIVKLFLYIYATSFSATTATNKFDYLRKIKDNNMINDNVKMLFFEAFCSSQQKYWRLNRLVLFYKMRKRSYRCHTDLYLHPILPTDSRVITIMHEGQKYLFTMTDVFQLVYSSITKSDSFFVDPLPVKNPYNNIPFSKANLYNIYFFLKHNMTIVPHLIDCFFQCEFDLDQFENENRVLLRDICIDSFINTPGENEEKRDLICNMLKKIEYDDFNNIIIDNQFPDDKLIPIMKPYLKLYLYSLFSLNRIVSSQSRRLLREKLAKFYQFNPFFGRKMIHLAPSKKTTFTTLNMLGKHPIDYNSTEQKWITTFNDNHIDYSTP
jgi:hypothetical protein